MNQTDLVNGLFEVVGGLAICVNIYRLVLDKHIAGVHWSSTAFFTAWGIWNMFFYPFNGLWFSFFGGAFLVFTNSVWLILLAHYLRQNNNPRVVRIRKKEKAKDYI